MNAPIMVIDDDPLIRDSLIDVLESHGYEAITAGDGAQALKRLQSDPLPALILLDLMMPVLDGRSFLERQQCDPRIAAIPVVLLTANRETPGLDTPAVVATLRKPMELRALLDTVNRCCAA